MYSRREKTAALAAPTTTAIMNRPNIFRLTVRAILSSKVDPALEITKAPNTQIHQLNERIKSLEEENGRLKKQLQEANGKNEELARRLSERAA